MSLKFDMTIEEALLLEKAIYDSYSQKYLNGYAKECKAYLQMLLRIEKLIRKEKGYEDHEFH